MAMAALNVSLCSTATSRTFDSSDFRSMKLRLIASLNSATRRKPSPFLRRIRRRESRSRPISCPRLQSPSPGLAFWLCLLRRCASAIRHWRIRKVSAKFFEARHRKEFALEPYRVPAVKPTAKGQRQNLKD